jgi:hypothetical protein
MLPTFPRVGKRKTRQDKAPPFGRCASALIPPNCSLSPTLAPSSISSGASTAPTRSWTTCRSQGLHGGFGPGLRFPDAPAFAANVARQAFQRLAFAHRLGSALNAQREDALPLVRCQIQVADVDRNALLTGGSGDGGWQHHCGKRERGKNDLHVSVLQHLAAQPLERRRAVTAPLARSALSGFGIGLILSKTYQVDGIHTGWPISESACRPCSALAATRG